MRRLALVALVALAFPAVASAHATLRSTTPTFRSELKQGPSVIRLTFDGGFERIATQQSYSLPTQMCMAHRVLPVGGSLYVSEMMSSVIAHLPVAEVPSPAVDEASDYYSDYGLGQPSGRIVYADPYGPV